MSNEPDRIVPLTTGGDRVVPLTTGTYLNTPRERTPEEVLAILDRAHRMSVSHGDAPWDSTIYGMAAGTIRKLQLGLSNRVG